MSNYNFPAPSSIEEEKKEYSYAPPGATPETTEAVTEPAPIDPVIEEDGTQVYDLGTGKPKAEKSLAGEAVDFLFTPKEAKTVDDTLGEASEIANMNKLNSTKTDVPDKLPDLTDQNTLSWLSGTKYDTDVIFDYLKYRTKVDGVTLDEAREEIRANGGTALDMSTAYSYDTKHSAPADAFSEHVYEPAKVGLARTGLAVAKVSTTIAGWLGADTTEQEATLNKGRGILKARSEEYAETYGAVNPVEAITYYAPEALSFGISGGIKTVMAVEGAVEFGLSKAEGFSDGQSLARATSISVITGGLTKWFGEEVKVNRKSGLTDGAELLAKQARMSNKDALDLINKDRNGAKSYKKAEEMAREEFELDFDTALTPQHRAYMQDLLNTGKAPAEDQAMELAMRLGGKGAAQHELSRAIGNLTEAQKSRFAEELSLRRQELGDVVGEGTFEELLDINGKQFDTMRELVRDITLDAPFDVNPIRVKLESFINFARNDTARNKIAGMVKNMELQPTSSLDELLEVRQEINYELGKMKDGKGKKILGEIKEILDGQMASKVDPKINAYISQTIDDYNLVKTREEFLSILDDATTTRGGGNVGSTTVVDYVKLEKKLKEANLGKSVSEAVSIVKKLRGLYGKMELQQGAKLAGENVDANGVVIATNIKGHADRTVTAALVDFLGGLKTLVPYSDARKAKLIDLAITKGLTKGGNTTTFIRNLARDKSTPRDLHRLAQQHIEKIDALIDESRKAPATRAEHADLIQRGQDLNTKVLKSQTKLESANSAVNGAIKHRNTLQDKLDEAYDAGDDELASRLEERLIRQEEVVRRTEQRLITGQQDYDRAVASQVRFDDLHKTHLETPEPFQKAPKTTEGLPKTKDTGEGEGATPAPRTGELPAPETPPKGFVPRPKRPVQVGKPREQVPRGKGGKVIKTELPEGIDKTTAMPAVQPEFLWSPNGEVLMRRPNLSGNQGTEIVDVPFSPGGERGTVHSWNSLFKIGLNKPMTGLRKLTADELTTALGTNKTAAIALKRFAPVMDDDQFRLASVIIQDNPDMTIAFKGGRSTTRLGGLKGGGKTVAGISNSNIGAVVLPAGNMGQEGARTFLHEIVHQATVTRFEEDVVFNKEVTSLFDKAIKHLKEVKHPQFNENYWRKNPKELLAEAMSNPKVQEMLASVPAPTSLVKKYGKSKIKNMWDAFTFMIANNIRGKRQGNVLEILGKVMAEGAKPLPNAPKQIKSPVDFSAILDTSTVGTDAGKSFEAVADKSTTPPQIQVDSMVNITKKKKMSTKASKELSTKLSLNEDYYKGDLAGNLQHSINDASIETQQELADVLFSSRKMDKNYRGHAVYGENDAAYKGMNTKMGAWDFLELAADAGYSAEEGTKLGREYAKDMMSIIAKKDKDKPLRVSTPFLTMNIDDGAKTITVQGHEGRHRSMAMTKVFKKEVKIPVDLHLRKDGQAYNRPDMTNQDFLDYKIVTEEGKPTGKTLRDMMPEEMRGNRSLVHDDY